jgi:hypothetical protein
MKRVLLTTTLLLPSAAFAAPTTVAVDEFQTALGSPIFSDSFVSTTTLVGGTGALQSSGVPFTGGTTPADYFVRGTILQTTANNGQATLNTASGTIQSQPPPFIASISNVEAVLQTGQTGAHALTPATAFTVEGLVDVSIPTTPLGTYDILLTNRVTANSFQGNVLELRVRDCVAGQGLCDGLSGPVLQYVWLDYGNPTNANVRIGEAAITPAEQADGQLLLELTKPAGSDAVSAFYAFGNGNTLGTFTGGPLQALGTTDAGTDVFSAGHQFVLPGFAAFDPVAVATPEPASLGILGLGVLGLVSLRRRSS